MNIEGDG